MVENIPRCSTPQAKAGIFTKLTTTTSCNIVFNLFSTNSPAIRAELLTAFRS
jgi:hypothetical protein